MRILPIKMRRTTYLLFTVG